MLKKSFKLTFVFIWIKFNKNVLMILLIESRRGKSMTTFDKQFITDAQGRQIGVILSIDVYKLVEPILRQYEQNNRSGFKEANEDKLLKLEQAAHDPLFLADLQEVMQDFAHVDIEGWEHGA